MSAARRKKGTGSVYEYQPGRYRAQIRLKDLAGKPLAFTEVFDTPDEAEEWLLKIRAEHSGGPRPALLSNPGNTAARFASGGGGPASFAEFMSIWMQYKYSAVKGPLDPHMKTLSDYESLIRLYMLPKLGTIRMAQLHWDNISDWIHWLRTIPSEKTGKPLSKSAQRRVWVVFKQAMKYATAELYVPRNPIGAHKGIEMPPSRVRKRAMTKPDFHKFQDYIRERGCDHANDYCELRWEIGFSLARRQSEVLALTYDNVFIGGSEQWMEVNQHMVVRPYQHGCLDMNGQTTCGRRYGGHCPRRHSGGLIMVEGTKAGEESTPMIPLTPALVNIFKTHRSKHRKELSALRASGKLKTDLGELGLDNLVFTRNHNGNAWTPSDDHQVFKRLLQEAEVSKDYRLHDLRHTSITQIIEVTGNLSTAQHIAGHRTIITTQKYVSPDMASLLRDLTKTSDALEQSKKSLKAKKMRKAKKRADAAEPAEA